MIANRRLAVLLGLMVTTLAVVALWNVRWMAEQRRAARFAMADLRACEQLADRIASLRLEPIVAASQDMGIQELGERIEQAQQRARMTGPALEGVFPQAARRVGDTPYMVKPTALSLRGVTLTQLCTFLYHLTHESGLNVRDLRLRSPRGDVSADQWDAEATLTYLIYSPPAATGPTN